MIPEYLELTRLVERLHRRFLDVLRAELARSGIRDLNGVQALLLVNVGEDEVAIRDLVERGYYQGSNVSYNVKKLTEDGYLVQKRATHDRRSVVVRLTEMGRGVVGRIREMESRLANDLASGKVDTSAVNGTLDVLHALERAWTDYVVYGPR